MIGKKFTGVLVAAPLLLASAQGYSQESDSGLSQAARDVIAKVQVKLEGISTEAKSPCEYKSAIDENITAEIEAIRADESMENIDKAVAIRGILSDARQATLETNVACGKAKAEVRQAVRSERAAILRACFIGQPEGDVVMQGKGKGKGKGDAEARKARMEEMKKQLEEALADAEKRLEEARAAAAEQREEIRKAVEERAEAARMSLEQQLLSKECAAALGE